ncbi:MAG: DUF4010 domain-containing protein [Gammaproteobacteria bacterium]|nr:DUF4010 domain-containing protein [Gammaproteobacteria bacterium]MBU1725958.1 DUF4010 domain-containing protein [Gammaproteobacteria bacterium]MBU2006062.1 DUF4010 domain-containing protein [Gammaproteobacteria bacterium]
MTSEFTTFYHLAVALALGLLIGIERGWKRRDAEEGQRIAGLRTFGLLGLLGGCTALLTNYIGAITIGLIFVGLAGSLAAIYVINLRSQSTVDASITSLIAALLVYVFGLMAGNGMLAEAAAAAVVTTVLLEYKPQLHRWVQTLQEHELQAGTKLLLISAVVLPLLPNQGYGPWQALNPYEIWWMVVLIAAISFAGYFALKLGGARKGAVLTGLLSGLVSSTALTLHFSRLSRKEPEMVPMLATGILLACGTMFPRMLLVASLLNREIFGFLLVPAAVMAVLTYVPALVYWRMFSGIQGEPRANLHNPLELKTAILFGILLAVIMLLGKGLQEWFGELGILLLAMASGVADVDAITLSLARMSINQLSLQTATQGIILAAAVNSLVKAGIATAIGGWGIGLRVGVPLLLTAVSGVAVCYFS